MFVCIWMWVCDYPLEGMCVCGPDLESEEALVSSTLELCIKVVWGV